MTMETLSLKPEASEPAPTTAQLETIVNGPNPETSESKPATPQSRLANMLDRGANASLNLGAKLEQAAINQRARTERGAEKFDEVKETMRSFGHNALALPRRAYLEARVQLNVGREVVADARDTVVGTALGVGDAISETAMNAKNAVVNKATEVKANVQDRTDTIKQEFRTAAEQTLTEVAAAVESAVNRIQNGIETGKKMTDQLNEGIEQKMAAWKAEYTTARDALGDGMIEKMNQLKQYFAERKEAALARKQARADARNERAAGRAKTREINNRVVSVETMRRLDEREANKAERQAKREQARQRGRAALTAIRVGALTAKETYSALK